MIVITRQDLSAGYQASMLLHAGIEFIFKFPFLSYLWHKRSNYVALLSVPDESSLLKLIDKLKFNKVRHSIFCEPDIDNQLVSVAVEPSDKARNICAGLPLALKEFSSSNGINKSTYKQKQLI